MLDSKDDKPVTTHDEHVTDRNSDKSAVPQTTETKHIDPVIEKRLVRKLDSRMLLWSFLAYFANLLDRNNMQNAFTNGMEEDLKLDSSVYNWAVTFFFIGYIILQIPGNMLITRVKPRLMLPSIVVLWGCVVCFMSLTPSSQALWGLRFLLGMAEAAYYPGMLFMIGSWYTTEESGKRSICFCMGNQISGAFGGLIAGAIAQNLDGHGGMRGWKWLFIIEGLIGVVVGIAGYFLLPNFPQNTPWLTDEEREVAIMRMQRQGRKLTSTKFTWKTFVNVLLSPYLWLLIIDFSCIYIGNNMSLNFAIILRDMGYPSSFANYMSTPCYIFSAIVSFIVAWSSDKTGDRPWHLAIVQTWVSVWYLIMGVVNNGHNSPALLFVGTYAVSINVTMSVLILTYANEVFQEDRNSRAIAVAVINAIGNLAPNFINVAAWVVSDSPAFRNGKLTSMGMGFGSVFLSILIWYLLRINFMRPGAVHADGIDAALDASSADNGAASEKLTEEQRHPASPA